MFCLVNFGFGIKPLHIRGFMKANTWGSEGWAMRAEEIYKSSKVDEKRQILNFLFSNLEMKDKKAIITLREPFDKLIAVSDHPKCRRGWDSNPRYVLSVHTLSKRAP